MGTTPSGTKDQPKPATPVTPDNGIPENADMATLMALADQARAALAAVTSKVEAAQAAEAAKVRKERLADVRKAAQAIVAQTDDKGTADLTALAEAAKTIWTTVSAMAKEAKVRTGGSRGPAGGDIRPGSDAAAALTFLQDNPGWHTVRQVTNHVAKVQGYPDGRDGQVRNALDKLDNIGKAEKDNGSPVRFRLKVTETPSVIAGRTTAQIEAPKDPEAPTTK